MSRIHADSVPELRNRGSGSVLMQPAGKWCELRNMPLHICYKSQCDAMGFGHQ